MAPPSFKAPGHLLPVLVCELCLSGEGRQWQDRTLAPLLVRMPPSGGGGDPRSGGFSAEAVRGRLEETKWLRHWAGLGWAGRYGAQTSLEVSFPL